MLRIVVLLAAATLTAAWAGPSPFNRDDAATAAAMWLAPADAAASGLAPELRAVRPADVDGNVPAIPPSELWPAQ